MSRDVDAVIAALRVVLQDAEARTDTYWQIHIVNKWIEQLPGARWGRWRELRLRADSGSYADRPNLIAHVRATLAYLETNRDAIAGMRSWWPFGRRSVAVAKQTAVKDVPARQEKRQETPRVEDGTTKPKWLN